jgi:putative transposase
MHLFRQDADFEAFERVMIEAHRRHPIRILSYCVLSNHWHFVVWPGTDGQVTAFFRWLAHTHAMRWRVGGAVIGVCAAWLYEFFNKKIGVGPGGHF